MTGTIFDIKEFAVHDGPGIRQTVFMKGCPLRCSWCHNPEGLRVQPELMVSPNGCMQCGACKAVCPMAVEMVGYGKPVHCLACGKCVAACPQRIRKIVGEQYTSQELANRLLQNAAYYASTGGGVTFSGGEPLLQAKFVLETMALLGPAVHKAVETSGYGDEAAFKAVRDAVDLVMFDLKCMDDEKHKHFTGVSNQKILRNALTLREGKTPFIIRIPVIPGVNDNDGHYQAVANLLKGAQTLLRVELLPYHLTAGAKYKMLQKPYEPGFDTGKEVHINLDVFSRSGIRSCVL